MFRDIIPPTAETHAITTAGTQWYHACAPGARMVCVSIPRARGKCGVSGTQTRVGSVIVFTGTFPPSPFRQSHTRKSICKHCISHSCPSPHTHIKGKSCVCCAEGVGGEHVAQIRPGSLWGFPKYPKKNITPGWGHWMFNLYKTSK